MCSPPAGDDGGDADEEGEGGGEEDDVDLLPIRLSMENFCACGEVTCGCAGGLVLPRSPPGPLSLRSGALSGLAAAARAFMLLDMGWWWCGGW